MWVDKDAALIIDDKTTMTMIYTGIGTSFKTYRQQIRKSELEE